MDEKLVTEMRQEELKYMQEELKLTEAEAIKFLESHDNFTLELGKLKHVETAIIIMLTTAAALALHRNIGPDKFVALVKEVVTACAIDRAGRSEDGGLNIVTWQKPGEA